MFLDDMYHIVIVSFCPHHWNMLLSYLPSLMIDGVYVSGVQLSIVDTLFINQAVDLHHVIWEQKNVPKKSRNVI